MIYLIYALVALLVYIPLALVVYTVGLEIYTNLKG